jgi:hypothetical protein
MPFLDDILMKGCLDEEKDEAKDKDGCRKFIIDHLKDYECHESMTITIHLDLNPGSSN